MSTVKLKGNPVKVYGELPPVGERAGAFRLVKNDLSDLTLEDFSGKKVVLNVFPSVDTPTCATSVRKFNEMAAGLGGAQVVCVSKDLPFAQTRFCGAEGINNVTTASSFRGDEFGKDYGVLIQDGALAGLYARAIIVIDEKGQIAYTQLVGEIADEPDYERALEALK
ncbi:MAG: thiol peroxidase [Bacteriovoracaceae bacterium]|mgnify:CR=1 FL=1|jgi:thioredoxin-dependent peroxiredoxin|nr:thiol peroxidase [Bacteriovoracaceae bacterium]